MQRIFVIPIYLFSLIANTAPLLIYNYRDLKQSPFPSGKSWFIIEPV